MDPGEEQLAGFLRDFIKLDVGSVPALNSDVFPKVVVWVKSGPRWSAVEPSLIDRLWSPHEGSRSLLKRLFRDEFGLNMPQYDALTSSLFQREFPREFPRPKLVPSGLYCSKKPPNRLAVVTELPTGHSVGRGLLSSRWNQFFQDLMDGERQAYPDVNDLEVEPSQ